MNNPDSTAPNQTGPAKAANTAVGQPKTGSKTLTGQPVTQVNIKPTITLPSVPVYESAVPQEGQRVRITGQGMEHKGKTGTVHQVSPSGTHVGVKDSKGKHIGYYHVSDVAVLHESMPSADYKTILVKDQDGKPTLRRIRRKQNVMSDPNQMVMEEIQFKKLKQEGWHEARYKGHRIQAKVYDEKSVHGIGGGRVSKLWVHDGKREVFNYDRGHDHGDMNHHVVKAVLKHFDGESVKEETNLNEARVPPLSHGATHLARYADKHYKGDTQKHLVYGAAHYMSKEDHAGLKATVDRMDTAVRDDVLNHIHPTHWAHLGYKALNHKKSVDKFHECTGKMHEELDREELIEMSTKDMYSHPTERLKKWVETHHDPKVRKAAANELRKRELLRKEELTPADKEELAEIFSSAPRQGDRVIVKHPSSPHNNKRGVYQGLEPRRKLHVVKHADGSTTYHGNDVLVREENLLQRINKLT